ncbi:unnamed protein product [Moneuplotes crassus]|uniref:Uncharacterized protein n=1 Tax=Euplotes crassus TaxID=5936 RepID=A0AAD1U9N3_EUPCR|nr:unnamed protein product [Moneuplotes crassus]
MFEPNYCTRSTSQPSEILNKRYYLCIKLVLSNSSYRSLLYRTLKDSANFWWSSLIFLVSSSKIISSQVFSSPGSFWV